ncbi:MAG: alanine--tRNA ligase-related protein [bacterium]|nr:alanine--tRNA ligase-related protein [bacterium]
MTSKELREKFLRFFKEKGHTIIPSASLVPENDPTVLFTTAGMHPLVPFLLGEKHPGGKKLANVQACIRTGDIDEVGDETHHTFFEMLGNWSLGDYFKEEAIKLSFDFLISKKWLGLEKEKLAISVFAGDEDAPEDQESKKIWLSLGIPEERIKGLPKKDNWWGPAGQTGPCGPDTEMFYWSGEDQAPKEFNPEDKKWVEIWNDVFMQYFKNMDAQYEPLSQKNVDTGMGLERMLSAINGLGDDYKTDVFWPIIEELEKLSGKNYEDNKKEFRIITDHIKAAVFLISEGILPSNVERGYVLRRILRRAIRYGKLLGLTEQFLIQLAKIVAEIYKDVYPELKIKETDSLIIIQNEEEKFGETIRDGLKKAEKILSGKNPVSLEIYKKIIQLSTEEKNETLRRIYKSFKLGVEEKNNFSNLGIIITNKEIAQATITGKEAFDLYQTYGFPVEMIVELAQEKKLFLDIEDFNEEVKGHQELSRTASAGMFKGGLADTGEIAIRYHTATHLLLAALRKILGPETYQKGSNITAERLRFDFNYSQKLTEAQIKEVEDLVNQKIQEGILVEMVEMPKDEAIKIAKISFDPAKYGEIVKVYKIGDFSVELCGGPHVKLTAELGSFKIIKEEASSSGVRRIRAVLIQK